MRKLLDKQGGSFGVKGIYRDGQTIMSKPYVFSGGENARDLADQIIARLRAKAKKAYPAATVLIVNCIPNCLLLDDEWLDAVESVRKAALRIKFREVFLTERSHSTTLYGDR